MKRRQIKQNKLNKHGYQIGNGEIFKMKKINLLTMLVCFSTLMVSCDSKKDAPPPPSVVVSSPKTMQITPYLTETGNTVAFQSIDLVARVSGYLDLNNFVDGSIVKEGDLLFVIQPQPYEDDVIEAQATLESNTAAYIYDKEEYARQQKLYKKHATSLADLQQWQSTTEQAAAAVESAKANLNNAEITYSYTHMLAPMTGRIGRHLIDPGNLVGNGQATELATLQQLDPMYVYFTINELDLLQLRDVARNAGFKPTDITQIPIEVALQNEKGFPHKGYLDFSATELDATTGTIQMRGILPNHDFTLLPGLFVQARIALSKPTSQLTVPNSAVLYDQIGTYVYAVDQNNKVEQLRVTTGSTQQNRIVITKGVTANDKIIVDGVQNATPGNKVTVTERVSSS